MKQTLLTGAKVSGVVTLIPTLMAYVPEAWNTLICMVIVVCGAVSTVVPVPHAGSFWTGIYKAVSLVGLNFGWAANRLASAPSTSGQPEQKAGAEAGASGAPQSNAPSAGA
ncbi:hypothetical protein OQ252_06700 [Acetobacter farinalis]|uniref:Holin n=1 Tax=Acetobacter farinalis TaxID=1260984 RepID=A0ABT3Q732_9PROT|nr:hypothetical protein [Acetobacter farinalis]MCX2561086.1 hypothetical protein [Acetobacter farinalis]NHO29665.1 hypothetical protein [Acetobacter farinalis]